MGKYSVELTKQAQKQLANLDKKSLALVASVIDDIEKSANPQALPNAKKLQGVPDGWRWRAGVFRILGVVDDDRIVIELFRIGHRRDVYRRI